MAKFVRKAKDVYTLFLEYTFNTVHLSRHSKHTCFVCLFIYFAIRLLLVSKLPNYYKQLPHSNLITRCRINSAKEAKKFHDVMAGAPGSSSVLH